MGKPVVMGRKTYLSIGKPLPGRTNIVVSRDRGFRRAGCGWSPSLEAALARRAATRCSAAPDEIVVIGGTDIFAQTHAPCRPDGDHPCACAAGRAIRISRRSMRHNGARSRAASIRPGREDEAAFSYVTYARA